MQDRILLRNREKREGPHCGWGGGLKREQTQGRWWVEKNEATAVRGRTDSGRGVQIGRNGVDAEDVLASDGAQGDL